ncbi:MAG TPA: hypothetical protein H9976_01340 [Candidatus Akkermansia intestinavium]|nr:hypothetical protein [Candidatus Akkermansia intestinavium]
MSDFYAARLSATYAWQGESPGELELLCFGRTLLRELPQRTWSLPCDEHQLVGSAWSRTIPSGNASLTLGLQLMLEAPRVALVEAQARRMEYALLSHREGLLRLSEAYDGGCPLLQTTWRAVVMSCEAHLCSLDDAPPLSGAAWALLTLELNLTQPQED